jgi:hypothetical protein
VATDRRARLGAKRFEELQINLNEFEDLLIANIEEAEFEQVVDDSEMVVDYS